MFFLLWYIFSTTTCSAINKMTAYFHFLLESTFKTHLLFTFYVKSLCVIPFALKPLIAKLSLALKYCWWIVGTTLDDIQWDINDYMRRSRHIQTDSTEHSYTHRHKHGHCMQNSWSLKTHILQLYFTLASTQESVNLRQVAMLTLSQVIFQITSASLISIGLPNLSSQHLQVQVIKWIFIINIQQHSWKECSSWIMKGI